MIGTMAGTNLETYFTEANTNSYLYAIGSKKLVLDIPDSTSSEKDPMKNMFLNMLRNHKNILVFGHDVDYPSYHAEIACHFSRIDEEYTVIGAGFVFQKHWPYTKLINNELLRLMEGGTVEHLRRRWRPKRIRCEMDPIQPSNFLDVFTLCVTLIMGGMVAIIALLIEVYSSRCV
jgi:hypothetical protein